MGGSTGVGEEAVEVVAGEEVVVVGTAEVASEVAEEDGERRCKPLSNDLARFPTYCIPTAPQHTTFSDHPLTTWACAIRQFQ